MTYTEARNYFDIEANPLSILFSEYKRKRESGNYDATRFDFRAWLIHEAECSCFETTHGL